MALLAAWMFVKKVDTPRENLPVPATESSVYTNIATKLAAERAEKKKKVKVNNAETNGHCTGSDCKCIRNNKKDSSQDWIKPKPRYDDKPDNVLFRTYRQTKQASIRDFLFFRWMKRATGIARRYSAHKMPYQPILSSDDLESKACITLLEAIESFDPERNDSFEGYLHQYVKWRNTDELRGMQDFPRSVARNRRELKIQLAELTQKLQKKVNLEDIRTNLGEEVYRKALDKLFFCNVFNQTLSAGTSKSFGPGIANLSETVLDDAREMPSSVLRDDIEKIVMHVLKGNHRSVIFQYYFMELTIPEIASNLEISTTSVCERRQEALDILRTEIMKQ